VSVGAGISAGLMAKRADVPKTPTAVLRVNPAVVRSSRYHRNGFASVRVRDNWRGEDHGSLRCGSC
jgi:hypothetical protein